MKARIGIADSSREIEIEIEGRAQLMEKLESAQKANTFLWLTSSKGDEIGVHISQVAYVELLNSEDHSVGFSR